MKTVVPQGTVGSNPTSSARKIKSPHSITERGDFLFSKSYQLRISSGVNSRILECATESNSGIRNLYESIKRTNVWEIDP